jgi:ABC-2 type transport system ATP-binding protein
MADDRSLNRSRAGRVIGHWPSVISSRRPGIGHQPSAIGHRSSAIRHQPSAIDHCESRRLMSERAIRVKDLRKQYRGRDGPVDAVNGLDLEVEVGECFGLLGPNGAGKTTTVEILEGLNRPTAGDVEVLGMRWRDHETAIRERIGVTLQDTRFPDKQTVREMLTIFRSFYRTGLEPDDVLARVSLEAKANSYVENLSGGQQQRLAVAIALVGDPELLFLDEPTTGLDPQSRRQLWDVIRGLRDRGRTVVLTTHYMDEAERLCDRVAIIDHGKIIALGSPAELIARVGGEHIVEFAVGGDAPAPGPESFTGLPTVLAARAEGDGFALTVSEPHSAIPALLDYLEDERRPLARLTTRQVSLEDVFVSLTGRHLRDDGAEEATADDKQRRRRRGRRL